MKPRRVALFGNFGNGNLGNEATLQAILHNLRRYLPDSEVTCICKDPDVTAATHYVASVPLSAIVLKPPNLHNPLAKLVRKVFIGMPAELCRWVRVLRILCGTDILIVAGTGLLTDAYGLFGFAPYGVFQWSLVSRICRCKLCFVSVGAGPIYRPLGKWLVRTALSLADFRSYRDVSSKNCLRAIGLPTDNDRVYPDLAFSFPRTAIPYTYSHEKVRRVVGIGVMDYPGKYSAEKPSESTYGAYLNCLTILAKWLLANGYDIRLLIGDVLYDKSVITDFADSLRKHTSIDGCHRISQEPALSVDQLLSQLATTDLVVATRFHNVQLALLLSKPVISIAFHHKCVSLMRDMGLSEFCLDIHHLDPGTLIGKFRDLEKNAHDLGPMIRNKCEEARGCLEEQYAAIFARA